MVGLRRRLPRCPRTSWVVASCLAVLMLAGCSDDPDEQPGETAEGLEGASAAEEGPDAAEAPDEDAVTEEADTPSASPEGPPRPDLGLPELALTTPQSGEGPRPELTWEPVEGASTYAVTVYAGPGERARWSWRGGATSVRVGFVEDTSVGGPNILEGMTWTVVAFDAEDRPIAQSGERPLSP